MNAYALIRSIRPGDAVTVKLPAGIGRHGIDYQEKTGRAVLCFPTHAVLNMGGRHGTPAVATPDNIIEVRKRRS